MAIKKTTVSEVGKKVINKDPLFILDVRNEDDYKDWKIEGDSFEYNNTPYFDLIDSVDPIKDELPKDMDIVVVCAKGGSSQYVTEQLDEAGFENVYSLEGGMKAWSEHLEPVKVADLSDGGELYQFVRLGKGCLSYMVTSGGEAAVIDPTRMIETFTGFAEEKNVKIKHVLDTHLHADHISGGHAIAEKTGAPYWLPPKDAEDVEFDYNKLVDGEDLTIGSSKIHVQALYSPGHTIGSTSFIVDDQFLLTGDILFVESIGRPDLAGKADDWVSDLRDTLYNKYRNLSNELVVLPAHYMSNEEMNEDGSVGKKLATLQKENHGLNVADENEFKKMVTENLPPQPNSHQKIRETNMGKINPEQEEKREMEIGPNRCAIK
ncbi:MBL fold metallo-hydrolase [Saliterribacillus persicus]|uniref:Glyoxylase-like metal-dependent hydrolase (Beta-lactamase superfamily II) n=1 Tax=Saliterribacillus persicus TaxID=930114 RepID=A0A368Y1D8_9BACI|nr:MBL fold metallo-hydrolase [Saliterribacillus persicus]RCW73176.1 glyoxylase-like metal-dependent hydrolase (beta-lactamase superfamily II) [Saliterribacillus persicus]